MDCAGGYRLAILLYVIIYAYGNEITQSAFRRLFDHRGSYRPVVNGFPRRMGRDNNNMM